MLLGCSVESGSTQTPQEQSPRVARSEVERGPVRLVVEVAPAEARLSDEPALTLTIDCQEGVEIQKPPFGESLGQFVIRDFREPLAETRGGRRIIRQIYTLEPTATGKLSVSPISVAFTDARPGGDGRQHTIESEAVTVEVASVVESDVPSLDDLRPMAGPVELPASGGTAGSWAAAAALGALALAGVWLLVRRRRKTAQEKPLSPRELAYLELDRLLAEDLAARDAKLFYVELTGILRRYIERTTGIRAAEQTTEEFLHQISGAPAFPPEESLQLKSFLESADLVKFAARVPRREDMEESFRRAKRFIGLEEAAEVAA